MDCSLPRLRTKFGERAFAQAGPYALPGNICAVADFAMFRKLLTSTEPAKGHAEKKIISCAQDSISRERDAISLPRNAICVSLRGLRSNQPLHYLKHRPHHQQFRIVRLRRQNRQQCRSNVQQSWQLLWTCCFDIVAGVDRALESRLTFVNIILFGFS